MSEIIVTIGEKQKKLSINDRNSVVINNKSHKVNLSKLSEYLYLLKVDDKVYEVTTTRIDNEEFLFLIDGRQIHVTARTALQEKANSLLKERGAASHVDIVEAPMPGLILKILKKEGEQVELGEPLIVLEAMKMENEIRSPASGVVSKIKYKEGESVEKNGTILTIE